MKLRSKATCVPPCHDGVNIVMTDCTPCELWMLNPGQCSVEVGPGELFGFNVGSFSQKPQGFQLNNMMNGFFGKEHVV